MYAGDACKPKVSIYSRFDSQPTTCDDCRFGVDPFYSTQYTGMRLGIWALDSHAYMYISDGLQRGVRTANGCIGVSFGKRGRSIRLLVECQGVFIRDLVHSRQVAENKRIRKQLKQSGGPMGGELLEKVGTEHLACTATLQNTGPRCPGFSPISYLMGIGGPRNPCPHFISRILDVRRRFLEKSLSVHKCIGVWFLAAESRRQ